MKELLKTYSIEEIMQAQANISYMACEMGYGEGEFHKVIGIVMNWTKLFLNIHKSTDWYDKDYTLTVEKFVLFMVLSKRLENRGNKSLLEEYDLLPMEVSNLIKEFNEREGDCFQWSFKSLILFEAELEKIGWGCAYSMDGGVNYLYPIPPDYIVEVMLNLNNKTYPHDWRVNIIFDVLIPLGWVQVDRLYQKYELTSDGQFVLSNNLNNKKYIYEV